MTNEEMDVNHYDDAKIALIESRCKSNTQDGVTYRWTGIAVYNALSEEIV